VQARFLHNVAPNEKACAPKAKNLQWLLPEHAKTIVEVVGKWDLKEDVSNDIMLDQCQLDGGLWEIVWRTLPGKVVCLPSTLTGLVIKHFQQADVHAQHGEGETLTADWLCLARKADLLIIPILDSLHWVLLVLQRSGGTAATTDVSEIPPLSDSVGCSKCRGTGCHNCCLALHRRYLQRHEAESFQVSFRDWPLELEKSCWEVRYYDSLPTQSATCAADAQTVLHLLGPLGVSAALPTPRNLLFQNSGVDCGLWVLHYAEQEMRVFRGEGTQAFLWPDMKARRMRLRQWLLKLGDKLS